MPTHRLSHITIFDLKSHVNTRCKLNSAKPIVSRYGGRHKVIPTRTGTNPTIGCNMFAVAGLHQTPNTTYNKQYLKENKY